MRAYIGITDDEWYRFLAARPHLSEVNFWRPSGVGTFRALRHGEPFLFKTHHPHNRIVGGGFFNGYVFAPVSEAWEIFGEGNGAADIWAMRSRIAHYRRWSLEPTDDPVIGCVLLRDVSFLPPSGQLAPPPDFARNIVQGKGYDLGDDTTEPFFADVLHRLFGLTVEVDVSEPWHRPGPVYGDPRLLPQRLGQQAFQAVVLQAYKRRCAVTGEKIRPVLQAAHIRPLPRGGEHRLDNGLLLRSDVHILFDRGYLGVDTAHRLRVSPRLRREFENGEEFYSRAGAMIQVPDRRADRPSASFLEWHMDEVFLAS